MKIFGNTSCRIALPLLGIAALSGGACKVEPPFLPTPENMSGSYHAVEMVGADQSVHDWLAAGATLDLNLVKDGTTSGHLFLPNSVTGSGDVNADMAGTWLLTGNVIQFGQAAATFVRLIDFSAGPDRIVGDQTFGDTLRIIIALRK